MFTSNFRRNITNFSSKRGSKIKSFQRDFDTETLDAVDRTLARVRQHRQNEANKENLSAIERLPIDVSMEIFGLLDPSRFFFFFFF